MKTVSSLVAFAGLAALLIADASAATVRVQCEARPGRAKISVDGKNLAAGSYTTMAISGANTATSAAIAAVGGEVQADYDSNANDVAAGAVAIAPSFITGSVVGKVIDASGNTVIADTVICRVRTR